MILRGMIVRTVVASVVLCVLINGTVAGHAGAPELKYFVEVAVPSLDLAKELAEDGFDIAGVNRDTSTIGIVVTPDELKRLEGFGFNFTEAS